MISSKDLILRRTFTYSKISGCDVDQRNHTLITIIPAVPFSELVYHSDADSNRLTRSQKGKRLSEQQIPSRELECALQSLLGRCQRPFLSLRKHARREPDRYQMLLQAVLQLVQGVQQVDRSGKCTVRSPASFANKGLYLVQNRDYCKASFLCDMKNRHSLCFHTLASVEKLFQQCVLM
jgi:hypothetical protein